MGNCFSSSSSDKNFSGEGRTLNAQPAGNNASQPRTAAAPPPKISGPGRTLGAESQTGGDPKAAAARAAEERARSSSATKGKLGRQLDAQRGQSQANALAQTARENVAARDAERGAETRAYN
ncbi:hypothetical protein LTR10_005626 [Elasticomyces elasticus]|nr:hypothetical protein LTR10_005626 [Elasticomyces elasticus]KAK4976365.1 hypothetical protein LTR42_003994 [Elasticomyces elasticus]